MPSHTHRRFVALATTTAVACALVVAPITAATAAVVPEPISYSADDAALTLAPIGSHESGVFDESAAEIVQAYGDRLFVVNAQAGAVQVLDWTDPTAIAEEFSLTSEGVANSLAIRADGLGVIAFEAPVKTDPGHLVFFDANAADEASALLGSVEVGALPDMVTVSKDGGYAVVANEAEPADDFSIDPEGSIGVVSLPDTLTAPTQDAVAIAGFHDFEKGGSKTLPADVRVFGPQPHGDDLPVSRNLEPEYITVVDGTAYAALQEANAIAVVDLATAEVTDILALGFKDLGLEENAVDPSDRDAGYALRTFPGLKGIFMPDGIQSYTAGGQTYLVTANEGDAREWGDYVEGTRAKDIAEDGYGPVCETSPLASQLGDADLGRLNVTTENGFNAETACYDELYAFGGRSFSIWTTDGTQVFDSGSQFEEITHTAAPEYFNSNHTEANFEGRSDDKGPEPENLTIGELSGRTYAFIGFERVGGIAVYDITDPGSSEFVTYVNNRDFAADAESTAAGDLGPEGIVFIAAEDSPTGTPVVVTGNEVSGTTTVFEITDHLAPATTDIQVLTINDFHGRIEQNLANGEAGAAVLAGAVDSFEAANPNTLFVSAGDNIGASTFTSFIQDDEPTIDALVAAGLDLSAVGNHEFDQGFADLTGRVTDSYGDAVFTLGANVYVEGTDTPALPEYAIEEVDGVRIGFIGTVTEQTAAMVSPTGIADIEFGDQLEAADRVAAELTENDLADVIVLLTHEGLATSDCADVLADDTAYGELIRGASPEIDAIVSGHTHQTYNCLVPVDETDQERPVIQAHQYGTTLGKLDISVDAETSELVSVTGGLVPLVKPADTVAGTPATALFPEDPTVKAIVDEAIVVAEVEGAVEVGSITADILRGGTAGSDRGVESSLGNLTADVYLWATSNEDYAGTPAEIGLMNPGGLRADLRYGTDGTMTFRDVADVQPFANTLVTVILTGAQLKAVLEEQWQPDGSSRPKLHLGVSDGFSYEYDPDAARGAHIVSMSLEGRAIADDDEFTVVTNSFLAAGGDNFLTFAEGTDRTDTGQVDLTATVDFFEANSPVSPADLGRAILATDDSTSPPPSPSPSSTEPAAPGSTPSKGNLATTGTELPVGIALTAALLLILGGVLFVVRRRRADAA
ncbi:choice-of-anchor I family protein [Microbacterium pygmaeum]|uniref:2',3'-cyclic-nucleotide 2'-phosphodiesterase/5'-or 3'-nucleotidase, 5'-nucleotidase family n=1 Tax=Microbacterium pygmaeum TaxID=370764 RepID=A0A1G7VVQ1_9MICO|nr:choice-of-anchor I family protein [Microbacterium pygmaeum]SDG63499.1 2',3'-cyclic-nucleotide 2'-phosphodiesterase/5'-or 3'-nucleotidase, 5'-nucleotidase family [Microbacterium pygmaeum]